MARIKIPADVLVHPETGEPVTFDSDTGVFTSESGETFGASQIGTTRKLSRLLKFLTEWEMKGDG